MRMVTLGSGELAGFASIGVYLPDAAKQGEGQRLAVWRPGRLDSTPRGGVGLGRERHIAFPPERRRGYCEYEDNRDARRVHVVPSSIQADALRFNSRTDPF